MRFHSSGSWGLGGWLGSFLPFFLPLKTIQFSTNKVQGKHESGWVLDTNSGLFTFVSHVLVHFPLWISSLILIWLSMFWGLVGFVMRWFFSVSFIFLMLSQWWSSITRWSHFIYINPKNFRAIHQDVKICCTKINIVCESQGYIFKFLM